MKSRPSLALLALLALLGAGCREQVPDTTPPDPPIPAPTGPPTISVEPPEDPPPGAPDNVLIILMDDLGQDKVGVYGVHPDAPRTPNIDAFAATGLRFTQAWAYPMCSPTRAAMLTGQHTRRYGIGDRLTPNVGSWELNAGERLTLPQMLGAASLPWDTSHIGKWHLSSGTLGEDAPNHPQLHGFAWSEWSLGNLYAALTDEVPFAERDYFAWEEIRNGAISWKETYATTEVVSDALQRSRDMQQPWLMWVALPSVHDPLHVPPPELYAGPEPGDPWPATDIELVDAMTEAMDVEIGRLIEGLDPDIAARTNIFLLGDNGTAGHGIAPPLDPTRDKGSVFEGGVRVPFIVSGPVVGEPGSVSDALVHVVDLFPTVAELAGIDTNALETEAGDPVVLDGRSIVPELTDPSQPGAETLYTEVFRPNGPGPYTSAATAVRNADYKYVRLLDGTEELYALSPSELYEGDNLLLDEPSLSETERSAWEELSVLLELTMADLDPS